MIRQIQKNREWLYLFFFLTMSLAKNDAIPLTDSLSKVLMVLGGVCWMLKMFLDKCTVKERVWQALLLVVGGVSFYYNHHLGPLLAVMVVIGLKDVRSLWIVKIVVGIQAAVLLVNGSWFLLTLAEGNGPRGYYEGRRIMGIWGVSRQYRLYFGSLHPNSTQRALTIVSALCVYLKKRGKTQLILCLTVLNLAFFFLVTLSNTGLMLWILFGVTTILMERSAKWRSGIEKTSPVMFVLMIVVTFALSWFYSPDNFLTEFVNKCITGRLRWSHDNLILTGISVWGGEVSTAVGVDCGYINLLLCYGIVLFLIYCVGVYWLMRYVCEKDMYQELLIVWLFQLYFIIESFVFVIWTNVTFVFIGMMLYKTGDDKGCFSRILNKLPGIKR